MLFSDCSCEVNYYGFDKDKIFDLRKENSKNYKKIIENTKIINEFIENVDVNNVMSNYSLHVSTFDELQSALFYVDSLINYQIKDKVEYRYKKIRQIIYFFENLNYIIVVGGKCFYDYGDTNYNNTHTKVRVFSKKQ